MPSSNEIPSFTDCLARHGLELTRDRTTVLQVNLGLLCDLACRHCHLEAGPHRTGEVMTRQTMAEVVDFARRGRFALIDVTGGAPELVPGLTGFLVQLAAHAPQVMLRTNFTALADPRRRDLLDTCLEKRVTLVGSLPAANPGLVRAQRGDGVWEESLTMLRRLNDLGYGRPDSGLELHLTANPGGAFLPPAQQAAEDRFRRDLERRAGVVFNRLFLFANMPLGRFRSWLETSGNLEGYLKRLAEAFNPCAVAGLMCRSLVSVAWDGTVYDCDFNLAAGLPSGDRPRHVRELAGPPPAGAAIATGEHCYGCTAGSGFT